MEWWNGLQKAFIGRYHLLFFTNNNRNDLGIPSVVEVGYDQKLFYCDLPGEFQELHDMVASIANKDFIWERFDPEQSTRKAFSWYVFWLTVIQSLGPAGVYIWSGHEVIADALAQAARATGTDLFFLERGPYAKTFACDRIGINFASSFVNNYDSSSSVKDSGRVERFAQIYYESGVSNWGQPDAIKDKRAFRKHFGIPEEKIVIFFPSQVDTDTNLKLYSPYFPTVYSAFKAVADELKRLHQNDVFLLGKKHPYQRTEEEQFRKAVNGIGMWTADANIFDCVRYADAVISINSSTAAEAALIGKPLLLLGQSILAPNRDVMSLIDRNGLPIIVRKLIDRARDSFCKIDYCYFERLLFGYLFSAHPLYNDLGVRSVGDIPLPTPNAIKNKLMDSESLHRLILFQFSQEIHLSRLTAQEINRLEEAIYGFQNSLSWKITSPLRWIRKKLGI
jgi:hypothetical protein